MSEGLVMGRIRRGRFAGELLTLRLLPGHFSFSHYSIVAPEAVAECYVPPGNAWWVLLAQLNQPGYVKEHALELLTDAQAGYLSASAVRQVDSRWSDADRRDRYRQLELVPREAKEENNSGKG